MDGYARAWLEYVFPVYIWGIVRYLVYISDRSTRAAKLLGSSPIPVHKKYIPLALVAVLFLLLLFLPYTLLLLVGQWLQCKCHLCLLSWLGNPNMKAIVDAP